MHWQSCVINRERYTPLGHRVLKERLAQRDRMPLLLRELSVPGIRRFDLFARHIVYRAWLLSESTLR